LLHQSRPLIFLFDEFDPKKAAAMAHTTTKTFLITGVSSGFGRALAQAALRDRHIVVGTVRKESDQADFEKLGQGAHAVILDVTGTAQIAPAVAAIENNIGAIDVLVNNAGYGHEGILEESSIDELRRQFEVNVFGAVAMIQAVLPAMRKRRAGHILNITSMGGIITLPGLSYYHGADPQAPHGSKRMADRRSRQGGAGDAEGRALGQPAGASSARQRCGAAGRRKDEIAASRLRCVEQRFALHRHDTKRLKRWKDLP
jgi:NAD(P)-dependent dehydrogenase (short-subunit alcohol dehydrogenase family)